MAVEGSGDIHALPEDCLATVLSLTSPKDACRLSAVASMFRSASQSDAVWDRFLPSDYRDIISRAVGEGDSLRAEFPSKKELYLHLCDHPILIDEGLKSFSLEKWSGKKCYMLAARYLTIIWVDSPEYWQWISLPESRFSEAAELLRVCWLEIRGKMNANMLSSCTNYAAYLVFTWNFSLYGFEHQRAKACVGIGGHECEKRMVCLDREGSQRRRHQDVPRVGLYNRRVGHAHRRQDNISMEQDTEYPKRRNDGWMEVELGEYLIKGGEDGDFEVSVMEVRGGNWKSGLIIQGIEIRPKECK